MTKYKVIIEGTTYNYVHSWKKWDIDERFMEFVWGKEGNKTLILRIDDIKAIETD